METAEIVVYMVVAVIVGLFFVYFIRTYDFDESTQTITTLFKPEYSPPSKAIDAANFAGEVYSFWKYCEYGIKNSSVLLNVHGRDKQNVTKEFLFDGVKKYNLCRSLQSSDHKCGTRNDVIFNDIIKLPALILLTCNESGLYVE
jgi:hypothetical protein